MSRYKKNQEYWIRFEGAGPSPPYDEPDWVTAIGRYYSSKTKSCFITAEWGEIPVDAVENSEEIEPPEWKHKEANRDS